MRNHEIPTKCLAPGVNNRVWGGNDGSAGAALRDSKLLNDARSYHRSCVGGVWAMNISHTQIRIRHSLGLPRVRAAFAGLGHAGAVLAFVVVATALQKTASESAHSAPLTLLVSFVDASITMCAALAACLPILVAACNLAPASGWQRYPWLFFTTSAAVLACVLSPLPAHVTGRDLTTNTDLQVAIFVVLLAVVLEFRHRALSIASALLRAEIDSVNSDARLRDASLRVLQAQVAPHFLFNTLANVRRLSQIDRNAAAAMIGDLVEYFSVTLARRDAPQTTLAEEARLVDAYLRIHSVRMGSRLAYEIDVPKALANVPIPSMLLLTLVENAIKHGLNPLVEGGFLRLRAQRSGVNLHLQVADNGRGLKVAEGHGTGLANTRARLALLYGARATLEVGPGEPRGFVANVSIPLLEGGAR